MVRSKLARALVSDLSEKKKLALARKKKILEYSNKIKKLWASGQISDSKYQESIQKEVDGKTVAEWTKQYDSYIDYYDEEIKSQKSKEFSKKIIIISVIFALILTLPLLALNGKISLVGFAVQDSVGEAPQGNSESSGDSLETPVDETSAGTDSTDETSTGGTPTETTTETTTETETNQETNVTETTGSTNETTTSQEPTANETTGNENIPESTSTTEETTGEPTTEIEPDTEPETQPIIPSKPNLTSSPQLIKNIPDVKFKFGGFYVLNLSSYFSNADEFYLLQVEGISTTISEDLVLIKSENNFIGKKTTSILATNKYGSTKSNVFSITILGEGQTVEETPVVEEETILETNQTNETNGSLIENQTVLETNLTNVTATNGSASITTTQFRPKIGEPVKWKKEINLETAGSINVTIPASAEVVSITKLDETTADVNGGEEIQTNETVSVVEEVPFTITGNVIRAGIYDKENLFQKAFRGLGNLFRKILGALTGRVIQENVVGEERVIEINDTAANYTIEYQTEAPQAFEEETGVGKRIIISGPDELNYTNVLAFTNLGKEVEPNSAKLYHIVEGVRVETAIMQFDTNGDNLVDYIEWNVPHLSNQTYELIIEITKAEHLDSNRNSISDIYENVSQLDDVWSEEISDGHYVRVTFEVPLDNTRDITIYPRIASGSPYIEVYEVNGTTAVANFSTLNENEYNKIFLTDLISESQDVFDLRIVGGSVEFDHIVDPVSSAFTDSGSTLLDTVTPTTIASLATTLPAAVNIIIASVQVNTNNTAAVKSITAGNLKLNVQGGATLASNEYAMHLTAAPTQAAYTLISTHSGSGSDAYNVTGLSNATYFFGESKIVAISGVTNYLLNDSASMTIATTESVVANLNTTFPAGDNIILASIQLDNGGTDQNITAGDIHIEDSSGTVLSSNEFRIQLGGGTPLDTESILLIAKDSGASANENYTVTMLAGQALVAEAKAIVFQAPDSAFVDGGSVAIGTDPTYIANLTTTFAANQELVVIGAFQMEDTDAALEAIGATNLFLTNSGSNNSANQYIVRSLQAATTPRDGATHTLIWRDPNTAANPYFNMSVAANGAGLNGEAKILVLRMLINPPIATLGTNPVNTYNATNSSIVFDFKASDNQEVSYVSLYGNWSGSWAANYTNTSYTNDTWVNITVTGIPEGTHTWGVFTNDTLGNANWTANRTFTIPDVTAPNVSFVSPTDSSSVLTRGYSYVNVTSVDASTNHSTFVDWNNSLVGWWRFDDVNGSGHPTDYKGVNNGTLQGGALINSTGKLGDAAHFDGVNDQITTSATSLYKLQDFSVSFWVYPKQQDATIVAVIDYDHAPNWVVQSENAQGARTYYLAYYDGTTWQNSNTQGINFTDNVWQHVTYVKSGLSTKGYKDGVEVYSRTNTNANVDYEAGDLALAMGYSPDNAGREFTGSLDDVLIFNRSLSAAEIQSLYQASAFQYARNFTGLQNLQNYTFKAYSQDFLGNVNSTATREIQINDTVYPQFPSTDVSPTNNSQYQAIILHTFNATINNTNNTVWLNINGVNYSVTNFSNGFFNITLSLSANESGHNYYWIAHGDGGLRNLNTSATLTYYIRKRIAYTASLSDTNAFVSRPFSGGVDNITVSETNNGDSDVNYTIWKNGTYAGDHISGANISEAGVWNFSLNSTAGTNYSSFALLDYDIKEITKVQPNIVMYLNASGTNITIGQGQTTSLNCTMGGSSVDSALTLEIWQNYTSGDHVILNRGTGVSYIENASYSWNTPGIATIFCNSSSTTNYTAKTYHNSVNVTSNSPTIPTVEAISAQNPIDGSNKTITFKFNVTDSGGVATINGSSATANFTVSGEPNRYNTSCLWITNYSSENTAEFQCAINMKYYDKATAWAINVSAKDNDGNSVSNTTTTFTYNSLTAMVMSPSALNWASLTALSTNAGADDDPALINNTGNAEGLAVKVTAYNLLGTTTPSQMIFAANMSAGTSSQGCDASAMVNATATTVTGATLNRRTDASVAAGQEEVYFCIEEVPSSAAPQTYSSSAYGSWTVQVLFVPVVAVRRKKTKKQKDLIKTIDLLLETIKIRNNLSNIESINLLAKIIRKEKYAVEDKLIESVEEILIELEKASSFSRKQVLELLINTLGKRYNIAKENLKKLKETTLESVSISVFSSKLGGLESLVKYMRENLEMGFAEISEKLNRDYRTIWTAYNQSKKKKIEITLNEKDDLIIPTNIFKNRKLTIFEAIVVYLKEKEMRYSRIAELLNRNQRNVWTMYSRATKK